MSQFEIQARLSELQDSIKQTAQLVVKLSKAQPGEDASADEASDLAADIQESLQQQELELELIKQDAEDAVAPRQQHTPAARAPALNRRESERERDTVRTSALCQRLTEDLHTLRTRFRKARLQSKKNADMAIQAEQEAYMTDLRAAADALERAEAEPADKTMSYSELRTSLFTHRRGPSRNNNGNQTKEDMVLTASSDLTASLRRTHALIIDQVDQSKFARETLEESNLALKDLNTRYGALDDLLSTSRGLLGSLLRSQKSDTWYLETARWILVAVIGWLIFRRLLYGPLWWFAYLPVKFAWSIMSLIVRSGMSKGVKVPDSAFQSSSRAPLIVQASARGKGPRLSSDDIPVVQVGGRGAADVNEARHSLSAQVSRIIESTRTFTDTAGIPAATVSPAASNDDDSKLVSEDSKQGEEGHAGEDSKEQEGDAQDELRPGEVRRGDGTILPARDEVVKPPNPKKRMMEVPPQQQPQKRDEL